jgi:maltose-binding protein MalE
MRVSVRHGSLAAVLAAAAFIAAGCGGDDESDSGSGDAKGGSINVAIVDNPQMKDIAKLTPSLFTAKSGIKVNYTVLDEGTLRQVTTRDVAAGGKQFDVTMIGMYEAPQFGQNGSLVDLTRRREPGRRLQRRGRHHPRLPPRGRAARRRAAAREDPRGRGPRVRGFRAYPARAPG